MPELWSSGGAGHRPLELNLGRRGGGDPSATVNTAKCVIADSYGRGFQRTPPQGQVHLLPTSELTRVWSQPALDPEYREFRARPATGSASMPSRRASSSSSLRRSEQERFVGRHTAYQFPSAHAWPQWQMPRPTNTTYGSFHAASRWQDFGLSLGLVARQF
mmetsp:Transcript_119150/g.167566  ORF Transcript_119150/g.167566 Transcript_119150/m.167566 type:complete len:161 (+) Transcript_119150:30-512(+)